MTRRITVVVDRIVLHDGSGGRPDEDRRALRATIDTELRSLLTHPDLIRQLQGSRHRAEYVHRAPALRPGAGLGATIAGATIEAARA